MTDESHVDGNALGATFHDIFGTEMTHRRGCCDSCGSIATLATLLAYRNAPGDVLRCAGCGAVVLAAVATPTGLRVSFRSLRWIEVADG